MKEFAKYLFQSDRNGEIYGAVPYASRLEVFDKYNKNKRSHVPHTPDCAWEAAWADLFTAAAEYMEQM